MTEFMRNSDAFTWAMESDPRLRSTVVTVIVLDRSPDWYEVRNRFDVISRKVPMVRQRVVPSPPPAPPRWEDAPDFDLDFHMRRVTAAAPGTFDTVLEMALTPETPGIPAGPLVVEAGHADSPATGASTRLVCPRRGHRQFKGCCDFAA